MKTNFIRDVRETFRRKKREQELSPTGTLEIQGACFKVDRPTIFGSPNEEYIKAEISWYESMSLNINDLFRIYGKEVQIWKNVASPDGYINSNYGWCVFSEENGSQYQSVLQELLASPTSRRAAMYYTRPSMHTDYNSGGMNDHMCTYAVQYYINDGYVEAVVYMRSNDAVYGFNNDVAWQKHVLHKLAADLQLPPGRIIWNAASLHVYPRHFDLVI